MKAGLLIAALLVVGPAAHANRVQPHQAVPRAVVKPAPKPVIGTAALPRHGSIGGPVNRSSGINGTTMPRRLSKK
jgi:hypothetical protein